MFPFGNEGMILALEKLVIRRRSRKLFGVYHFLWNLRIIQRNMISQLLVFSLLPLLYLNDFVQFPINWLTRSGIIPKINFKGVIGVIVTFENFLISILGIAVTHVSVWKWVHDLSTNVSYPIIATTTENISFFSVVRLSCFKLRNWK